MAILDGFIERLRDEIRSWFGDLKAPMNRQPSYEKTVLLDLNQDEEVRYVLEDRPASVRQIAESLLEILINHSL